MKPKVFIAIVGVVLVLGGLSLGLLIPVSVDGPGRAVSCGPAWGQDYADAVNASNSSMSGGHDYRINCRASRGTQGTMATILAVIGGLTVLGAATIKNGAAAIKNP